MDRRNCYLLLIVIAIVLTACSPEREIERVEKLIEKEKYERAENKILKLQEKGIEDIELDKLLIEVLEKSKKTEKLEVRLKKGLEKSGDIDYRYKLVDLYMSQNRQDEAARELEEIIKEDKTEENYQKIFKIYRDLDDFKKAIILYERDGDEIDNSKLSLELAIMCLNKNNELKARNIVERLDLEKLDSLKEYELLSEYYFKINDYANSYKMALEGIDKYGGETILRGYKYGFVNSDGLNLIELGFEDINGDGRKENIILLSENKDMENSGEIILVIQESDTGSIVRKKRLKEYQTYENLQFADFNKDGIKDIYIDSHKDSTYIFPKIYTFLEDDIGLLTQNSELGDLDTRITDSHKLEIFFGNKNKKLVLDLEDEVDRDLILENEIENISESVYRPTYIKELDICGVEEEFAISILDKELAKIKFIYVYNKGSMTIYDFIVETDYRVKEEKYLGKEKKKVDDLKLEDLEKLLLSSKKQIYAEYGRPRTIDYLDIEILDYDGLQFFIKNDQVKSIRILNRKNILGIDIPTSYENILDILGEPEEELIGEMYVDELELVYQYKSLRLKFSGRLNGEESFILYVEKKGEKD